MLRKGVLQIRNATQKDLPQLLDLEKIWPESSRATEQGLNHRIETFAAGFFVVEDEAGIYASVIAHPYRYDSNDLSNFQSWNDVNQLCFLKNTVIDDCNALYVISATNKKSDMAGLFFRCCVDRLVKLAYSMNKLYLVAGVLLPGYANYIKKYGAIEPDTYVFKQINGRCVDPLIEKLRRIGFSVPSKSHVLAEYYPDSNSLNYSALVVKSL